MLRPHNGVNCFNSYITIIVLRLQQHQSGPKALVYTNYNSMAFENSQLGCVNI